MYFLTAQGEPSGFALAEAKLRPSYAGQVCSPGNEVRLQLRNQGFQ